MDTKKPLKLVCDNHRFTTTHTKKVAAAESEMSKVPFLHGKRLQLFVGALPNRSTMMGK